LTPVILGGLKALIEKIKTVKELEINKEVVTSSSAAVLARVYEPGLYAVSKFIAKRGGSFEQSRDIFHDALLILLKETQRGKNIESEVEYVVGISKHLWYRKIKEDITERTGHLQLEIESEKPCQISETKVLEFLLLSGKRCLDMLTAFYFKKQSITEVARDYHYSSEHSASVQKYKCIEKLRETIRTKSMSYEDFFE
jgi:hypothetical protein